MFYMHLENIRNLGDLIYWLQTHAFAVPIIASFIAFCLVWTVRPKLR